MNEPDRGSQAEGEAWHRGVRSMAPLRLWSYLPAVQAVPTCVGMCLCDVSGDDAVGERALDLKSSPSATSYKLGDFLLAKLPSSLSHLSGGE